MKHRSASIPDQTVVTTPDVATCAPLQELQGLLLAGRLPSFAQCWGREPGDCHKVVDHLIFDLAVAESPLVWTWWHGIIPVTGLHSWLEADGWAIDAANGLNRPILVMDADTYRRERQPAELGRQLELHRGTLRWFDSAVPISGLSERKPLRLCQ